jgi:tRNA nucleotidyltransferase (CCA-adding enzyme)
MMGHPFAEHFMTFLAGRGLEIKNVAKIESRPEQSKHLETARTTVLGIELDFVNLRSEEYAAGSRIPTAVVSVPWLEIHCVRIGQFPFQEFGTPLQDALRRDITINTLFYNVHSRTVEDHTEMVLGTPRL